jgi:arginase
MKANLSLVFETLAPGDHPPQTLSDTSILGLKRPLEVSAAAQRVSSSVFQQVRLGRFVLTLGGDHSIGAGTVSGTAKAIRERFQGLDLGVLWIDAHADINTPETSVSKRLHGMPVAFASGIAKSPHEGVFDWLEESHIIDLGRFVYIGLRDVDEAEKEIIARNNIMAFMMDDIRR